MIIDRSEGRFDEIQTYAKERGLTEQLQTQLDSFGSCFGEPTDVIFYADFAPYSLSFVVVPKGMDGRLTRQNVLMNGALIYHRRDDNGVDAPTFSVRCSDDLKECWLIHT